MDGILVELKKLAIVLIAGFFALVFIGARVVPYRTFIASTHPAEFPFVLGSGVSTMSVTSLPDDHVVLCYVANDTMYYKESFTRGFAWHEALPLFSTNLSGAANLHARAVRNGEGHDLLLAWDALSIPGNDSSRRAFHAALQLSSFTSILGPAPAPGTGNGTQETHSTLTGDPVNGYHAAWIATTAGNMTVHVYRGDDLFTWTHVGSVSHGVHELAHAAVVTGSCGTTDLFYVVNDGSQQAVMSRTVHDDHIGDAVTLLVNPVAFPDMINVDYSLTSKDDVLVSFHDPAAANTSFIFKLPARGPLLAMINESIVDNTAARMFQHVSFSNDQVLAIWMERDPTTAANHIMFTITAFEMTNRNSIYHSMLLGSIFISCGVFNHFVFLHLKHKGRFTKESEPLNFHFMTIALIALGITFMVPASGFAGEALGGSHADGFIYPAPINLATLIVIGFSGLFFLVSTPLINTFYKRGVSRDDDLMLKDEVAPYSLKQEFLRKLPHLLNVTLILGFDPVGSSLMQFVDLQKYNRYNFINEGAIIFDYVLRLNNLEVGSYAVKLMLGAGLVFLWILGMHVLLARGKQYFLRDYIVYSLRKKEKSSLADFVVMYAALLSMIVGLTFNPALKMQGTFVCLAAIGSLCLADCAGVFVGKTLGRHRLSPRSRKTWEGALAGVITAFLFSLPFLTVPFALLVAGLYLVVDLVTPKIRISDNILIPVLIMVVFLPLLPWVESPLWSLYMG